jgi:TolB protein
MLYRVFSVLLFILSTFVYAEQNIEIVGGGGYQLPSLAIINFTNDKASDNNIANILASDFNITGEFKASNYDDNYLISMLANSNKIPANYIVLGSVLDGVVNFKVQNNDDSRTVIVSGSISNYKDIRQVAHTIANQIYKQLTNVDGVFTSKIILSAYDNFNKKYKILVADYDGYNQKVIYSSKNVLASVAIRANGSQIAYVEIINQKPQIYVQNLYANKDKKIRYLVSAFSGSNSAPVFMPDGNQLLTTLTNDDGSNISMIDNSVYNDDSYRKDIITWGDIATEADIGSNESVVFSSNHDGGAQIFMTNINNLKLKPTRLTLDLGNYNVTPRLSHDLNAMVFIHRVNGELKTYYMNFITNSAYSISHTSNDLSPSFSLNDKLIAYTSDNFIYITNKNGTISHRLKNINFSKIIDVRWAGF